MRYNLFYHGFINKVSILNIDEYTLNYILKIFKNGGGYFLISGKYYSLASVKIIEIFENPNEINDNVIKQMAAKESEYYNGSLGEYVSELFLSRLGENVTSKFLKDKLSGNNKIHSNYINANRIEDLKSLSTNYDLNKLIMLCEELNSNFQSKNYFSVAILGRAIIDHIPPIFGLNSFNEVANNYGSKSIKGSLKHLNESMRNISDGILHSHIRKKESLATKEQVNFSQDLDVLLGEIISVLS